MYKTVTTQVGGGAESGLLNTLETIGFTTIQVINSRLGFNTIYARKLTDGRTL